MAVKFTWDPKKAESNYKKHRVRFEEAATAFDDPNGIYETDLTHHERGVLIAMSRSLRLLFVVHVRFLADEPVPTVRLISARRATKKDRRHYESSPKRP